MELQKLTVHHYSDKPEEEKRVTLAPMHIIAIMAGIEDITVNNRSVRSVGILFSDGGSIELNLNHSDMSTLESAIGSYCFE